MTIHLVRHGETAYNRDHRGLGRSDEPLTDAGRAQSEAVAAALAGEDIALVLTSPLQRAAKAAELIASTAGLRAEPCPGLIEMDVGDTEGLDFASMRERFAPFFERWRGEGAHDVPMPGGESMRDIAARLSDVLATLRQRGEDETVVVVSHNFVERALICELLGLDLRHFRSFAIDLASITSLAIRRGQGHILRLNDVCHLHSLESSAKQT